MSGYSLSLHDEQQEVKMEHNNHNQNICSYEPQIHGLEKQIQNQEHKLQQLYKTLNRETVHLSKLQANLSELQQLQQIQNEKHQHSIQAERQRMEENDHEVAMQLQRQLDREQQQHRYICRQRNRNRNRNRNTSVYEDIDENANATQDDEAFSYRLIMNHINRNHPQSQRERHQLLNSRNQFLLFGSSPFNSPFGGSSFDQSAFNAIHRSRRFPLNGGHYNVLASDDFDEMSYEELNELFPNMPQGANEETIESLPMSRFKRKEDVSEDQKSADAHKNKCCICLEPFVNGDEIRRLPCMHIFHKTEIDQWLRQNRKCPICRIDIEEQAQHQ